MGSGCGSLGVGAGTKARSELADIATDCNEYYGRQFHLLLYGCEKTE